MITYAGDAGWVFRAVPGSIGMSESTAEAYRADPLRAAGSVLFVKDRMTEAAQRLYFCEPANGVPC